jgi:hypothetical protein
MPLGGALMVVVWTLYLYGAGEEGVSLAHQLRGSAATVQRQADCVLI